MTENQMTEQLAEANSADRARAKADILGNLNGKQKAAILMLAIGREKSAPLFKSLHEDEVRDISAAMSELGPVKALTVEAVCEEFNRNFEISDGIIGNYETTEEILRKALPADVVERLMEDLRGPSGRSVWDKMSNMPEVTLSNYLRNEQPQIVAVILNNLPPVHVAKIISLFPQDFAIDVIYRMLHVTSVNKDVLDCLETTLRKELVSTFGRSSKRDSYAFVAEIYNNFDRKTESVLTEMLGERDQDDMEKVNKLKFTFDDIKRLTHPDMMRVVNAVNKDPEGRAKLALALKGVKPEIRDLFLACMAKRAGAMLLEEVANLGPVRMKDVEAAQFFVINIIKDLASEGEVDLAPGSSDDELVD
ncbi:flagellar motor switch protein FliG [Acetobacter persici]|nr:flagellar motor switch protein FliG [Acetobacter persici]